MGPAQSGVNIHVSTSVLPARRSRSMVKAVGKMLNVPSFYVDPSSSSHLDALLRCGEQIAKSGAGAQLPQWHRSQLANPVLFDVRGGLAAELLLCQTAMKHPRRVANPRDAEVVLVCPHFYYNALLDSASACAELSKKPANRTAPLANLVKSTAAWSASRAHVFVGAVEYSSYAYRRSGYALGQPPPAFVMHANAAQWKGGVARRHAVIPFSTSIAFMRLDVKRRADARADEADHLANRGDSNSLDVLSSGERLGGHGSGPAAPSVAVDEATLYFRGTLNFGSTRGAFLSGLNALNASDIVVEASLVLNDGARTTDSTYAARTSDFGLDVQQTTYVRRMLTSTFCLTPSGHTCETRRFYDAIAAGCIPIIVDCEYAPYPFDSRIDFREFVGFYPLAQLIREPAAFVDCLRRLQRRRDFVRRVRRALSAARKHLVYGWWKWPRVPNASDAPSLRGPEWELAQPGSVLEQLLVESLVARPGVRFPVTSPKDERLTSPSPTGAPLPGRNRSAFDLREACRFGLGGGAPFYAAAPRRAHTHRPQ